MCLDDVVVGERAEHPSGINVNRELTVLRVNT
jgi:hypothetical protein